MRPAIELMEASNTQKTILRASDQPNRIIFLWSLAVFKDDVI